MQNSMLARSVLGGSVQLPVNAQVDLYLRSISLASDILATEFKSMAQKSVPKHNPRTTPGGGTHCQNSIATGGATGSPNETRVRPTLKIFAPVSNWEVETGN